MRNQRSDQREMGPAGLRALAPIRHGTGTPAFGLGRIGATSRAVGAWYRRVGLLGLAVVAFGLGSAATALQAEQAVRLPEPVELGGAELMTKDGVQLAATYYPGTRGKDTVPIICLHMFKGDRREYATLAPMLQEQGHAVLVPDLRGHGASTRVVGGMITHVLDPSKLSPEQFGRMVTYDLETLKAFLMKKNNQGELNIEKLCLIGADMGATVALDWARLDWSWPMYPGLKQGQDVKALVLISPKWSQPGINLLPALNHPMMASQVSVFLVVGKQDTKALADAKRIHGFFKRFNPDPAPEEATQKQKLFFWQLDTRLQGTKLLGVRGLNLERNILRFVELRLVNQAFPWQERGQK